MPLFVVDPTRCTRDGVCVAECPTCIIELAADQAVPRIAPEAEEFCRRCGHCIAVCRSGAIAFDGTRPEQLPPTRPEWLLAPEHMAHFLRARRSVRTYASRPVERELLTKLLDIARYAPSASNRQAVNWLAIYDSTLVRRLAGLTVDGMRAALPSQPPAARRNAQRFIAGWEAGRDMVCRGAPHLLIACAPADYTWATTDGAIALTYVELAAPSFGLGTCWAGILTAAARQWPPLQEALALPSGQTVSGALMVGYPRYRYARLPERNTAQVVWRG